jgi:hypothetical protein
MHVESYRLIRSSFFRNGRNTIMKRCAYSSFFTVDRLGTRFSSCFVRIPLYEWPTEHWNTVLFTLWRYTAQLNERVLWLKNGVFVFCLFYLKFQFPCRTYTLRSSRSLRSVKIVHCLFFACFPPMFRNFMIMFSSFNICRAVTKACRKNHYYQNLDIRLAIKCMQQLRSRLCE